MKKKDLSSRIEQIRKWKQALYLDNVLLAEKAGLVRVTVSKTLSIDVKDTRYLTEGNVSALEQGIEKIVDEFEQVIVQYRKQNKRSKKTSNE